MAKKADFTSEEWQLILTTPQVAALYLAPVPAGRWDWRKK